MVAATAAFAVTTAGLFAAYIVVDAKLKGTARRERGEICLLLQADGLEEASEYIKPKNHTSVYGFQFLPEGQGRIVSCEEAGPPVQPQEHRAGHGIKLIYESGSWQQVDLFYRSKWIWRYGALDSIYINARHFSEGGKEYLDFSIKLDPRPIWRGRRGRRGR